MTEIIPGIHWLKLPVTLEGSSLTHINAYLIQGDKGYLLVDAGWNTDATFSLLHNYLVKNNLGFEDIAQIVITHAHPDHYGMAGRVARLSGAPVAMHPMEQAVIEPRYVHMDELLNETDEMLTANGVPHEEMVNLRDATKGLEQYIFVKQPDKLLRESDTVTTGDFNFQVIWTPGHASGHICLYEPARRLLLSGDHILPKITPNISVNPQSIENPLGRYLDSLARIRKLDIETVLPGHDQPFKDVKKRIDELTRHHEWRNAEILATIETKPLTAYDVAEKIGWGQKASFSDLPYFHRRMAVFETLAHLEMMAAEGRLDRYPKQGLIRFSHP